MKILLYLFLLLCCGAWGILCMIQSYLMLADAISSRRGRGMTSLGGMMMLAGAVACFAVFIWLLNNSPL